LIFFFATLDYDDAAVTTPRFSLMFYADDALFFATIA